MLLPSDRFQPQVDRINQLEAEFSSLSDAALQAKTAEFKERVRVGKAFEIPLPERLELERRVLDEILPEAFAVVREAARRALGLWLYNEQLMGGIALHNGAIAQMDTGEGKTLTAIAPAYLNALTGRGVHIVTANDFLAWRDGRIVSPIYTFLGLVAGSFQNDMKDYERRAAFSWDITYATHYEIGFEYLRDRLASKAKDRLIRDLNYVIVDELDAILIEEARTPLIISSSTGISAEQMARIERLAEELHVVVTGEKGASAPAAKVDAIVNRTHKTAVLTEQGLAKSARRLGILSLFSEPDSQWIHRITRALEARYLMRRGTDYSVIGGEVVPLTAEGKPSKDFELTDGIADALFAREGLNVAQENQTLATITFQNYFNSYRKLSGMTATAADDAAELKSVYDLDVAVIPSHRPCIRKDLPDRVYRTKAAKLDALVNDVSECWAKRRPVIIATRFTEDAKKISGLLKAKDIPHHLLGGRGHELMDGKIVEQAGRSGSVLIIPEHAGRGVHIGLGGLPPDEKDCALVRQLGGIHIICAERGHSRAMDDQIRGRVARQGEPGSSQFYLSLEDDLARLFGGDRLSELLAKLNAHEDQPIESDLVNRQLESGQKRIEEYNRDIRRQLLDYYSIVDEHARRFFDLRENVLAGVDLESALLEMVEGDLEECFSLWLSPKFPEAQWDSASLAARLASVYGIQWRPKGQLTRLDRVGLLRSFGEQAKLRLSERLRVLERDGALDTLREELARIIDAAWKGYYLDIDRIKKLMGKRNAQEEDPQVYFKRRASEVMDQVLHRLRRELVQQSLKAESGA